MSGEEFFPNEYNRDEGYHQNGRHNTEPKNRNISQISKPKLNQVQSKKDMIKKVVSYLFLDGLLITLVLIFFIIISIYYNNEIPSLWINTITSFGEVIPIFIVASFLAEVINIWVDREKVTEFFGNMGLIKGLLVITAIGVTVPGPIYSIFPLVLVLIKKGIKSHYLIAFLTGQTLMGPMRIILELQYMGVYFLLWRGLLSIMLGVIAGLMAYPFHKYMDKDFEEHLIHEDE
ncbi:MAG: permease [Promethearchaeota archaeon]